MPSAAIFVWRLKDEVGAIQYLQAEAIPVKGISLCVDGGLK